MKNIIYNGDNNDTGEADVSSIAPIKNGEEGDQTSLNRPIHVLRERTETARSAINNLRIFSDLDRGVLFHLRGGNGMTWGGHVAGGGTGGLVLGASTNLEILPMASPGEGRGDYFTSTGATYPSLVAHKLITAGPNDDDIQAKSTVFATEGGNSITLTITDVPGSGAITVAVTGDGSVTDPGVTPAADDVVVTYDSTLGHTIDDVITAVNTSPLSSALLKLKFVGADPITDPMFDVPTIQLEGGLDAVRHVITPAVMAAFFAAAPENLLREGDTLALAFTASKQRRDAFEENSNAHLVTSSQLVNLTANPEAAGFCVPIGKVINDEFLMTSGSQLAKGVAVSNLNGTSILRADLNKPIAAPPAEGANAYGSELVGINTSGFLVVAAADSTLQQSLDSIDALINTTAAEVTKNKSAVIQHDKVALRVENLYEVDALTTYNGAAMDNGDLFIYDGMGSTSLTAFARGIGYEIENSLTPGGGGVDAVCASGKYFYYVATTGTVLTARALSAPTAAVASTALAAKPDYVSATAAYVATGLTNGEVGIWTDDLGSNTRASAGVGPLPTASDNTIRAVKVAGDYTYVVSVGETSPGVHSWYLYALNNATGVTNATSLLYTGTSTADYREFLIDVVTSATAPLVYVINYADGTTDHRLQEITHDVFAGTLVGTIAPYAISATDVADMAVDMNTLYFVGTTTGLGAIPRALIASGATAVFTVADVDSGMHLVSVDSENIYVMAKDGSGNANILYAYDKRSRALVYKQSLNANVDAEELYSNDQYLVTFENNTTAANDTITFRSTGIEGGRYRYTPIGQAPLHTNYVRLF